MTDIAIIVAVASNNVIGKDNELPWHLPEDLKWFKRQTLGKPILMGRKTFESLGRLLPGRTHIVISRNPLFQPEGAHVVPSLEKAIELGSAFADKDGVDEIMVIGGGEIYSQAIPMADKIYRTLVDLEPEGDTFFPELGSEWVIKEQHPQRYNDVNYFFQVVEKFL